MRHHHETLLTSLWNYVLTMRRHHEAPPWALTKRVTELRPNHEAPPRPLTKRVMELRPNHEAPPWDLTKRFVVLRPNYEAPLWDLTKRFMELRPKPYQNHVTPTKHKFIMHTNLMPIFITNHLIMFHTKFILSSSIQIPIHHVEHTRHWWVIIFICWVLLGHYSEYGLISHYLA